MINLTDQIIVCLFKYEPIQYDTDRSNCFMLITSIETDVNEFTFGIRLQTHRGV